MFSALSNDTRSWRALTHRQKRAGLVAAVFLSTTALVATPFPTRSLPDGQISHLPVHTPLQKYSASVQTQINSRTLAIPFPQEGRFAVVTDVGSGMRWMLWRHAREVRADE